MSALLDAARALADGPIPDVKPGLPKEIQQRSETILGWTAGAGLVLATMAGLLGFALSSFGEFTERAALAAKAKKAIIGAAVSGLGIGLTSSLVLVFYRLGA